MNAFRLYVGFTPSAPKVSAQPEAPVLPYLCRKALTPLLRLTALPRVAEHSSQKRLQSSCDADEELVSYWKTQELMDSSIG